MPRPIKGAPKPPKIPKSNDRGVVYLGSVPRGFEETEMKKFFSQFGEVTRLRISRNKKTGRMRHYAFIEFADENIAKVVAQSMDQYILYERILKAKFVPKEFVHPKLFFQWKKKWRKLNKREIMNKRLTKPKTEKQLEKRKSRIANKDKSREKKLKSLGFTTIIQRPSKDSPKS
ncbi:putative RNA-binding domain-containing protein [Monocercomonoides exilis]|uniref:putative RNA-binding domain-containing protein n=1 Tax=Monocercomonoides exilis TaxID=2049356 RepID=UPI003559EAB3|nr:putative RNA-binding domain-containing protein [Monocercomonoides exilis]|eukprot:MONOS_14917.1-p1 / transcript=MONOS_14917.1 / gene=MONOS_14917 / organism=Monocercomonoides_exilis_PA203 / gene_product=RNA-binding domain-containing protein / transcript_product=RNA-binding domain-containing protein / location=Mono_scaffold01104:14727-15477(+) / protein_length=173 / sequence_SO=supercontig / SO=protein_coding / is_pseudo=false